jgi:hypothetical protein
LEDYAFFVWGLTELYEATFRVRYLEEAVHLTQAMVELFWDEERGGFYFTGKDNEELISRPKELYDGATPSGNSVAALNLLRLGRMTGRVDWERKADRMVRVFSSAVSDTPVAYAQFLNFLDFFLGPSQEVVIAGDPGQEESRVFRALIQKRFQPGKILLFRSQDDQGEKLSALCPFVAGMRPLDGRTAVYICEGYSCKPPLADLGALKTALG